MTTIAVDPDVKEMLKDLKITPDESFNSVIKRIAQEAKKYKPMFPKENAVPKVSQIPDIDAWIERKLVEDKEILDALGRK